MEEIKRKTLINGDVIEIEIKDYGYVYAKYINVLLIYPEASYPDLLRIYKTVYNKPLDKLIDINRQLLIAPLAIAGIKGIFKTLKCKIVLTENVSEEEKVLPDVKRGHPPFIGGYDETKYNKWMVLSKLGDTTKTTFSTLEKVRHLEWAGATNVEILPFRIKLEILKLNHKDIKKEEGINGWLEEEFYQRSINMPSYSKLEKSTRDFVLK